jgi:hypothetical protein
MFDYNFLLASIFDSLYLFKILILELKVMKNVEEATKHGKIM